MRYGVLSDVHGNLAALHAVVALLRRRGVDDWLCAGDLVGYGPHPNECVDVVIGLGARTVAGNHDLIAAGRLTGDRSSPRAQRSHAWTHEVLRDDVRAVLRSLPLVLEHDRVVLGHGSLHDPEEYVASPRQRQEQVRLVAREHPSARTLVLGHTHRQHADADPGADGVRLVNPGSVGQSREWEWPPRARAAVLDSETGEVELVSVHYPVLRQLHAATRGGLGYRSVHSPPSLRRAFARRTQRLLSG